jgi:class 3 adenylate cyclase/pimeloyl-ACP methyl ester carboxylesterase
MLAPSGSGRQTANVLHETHYARTSDDVRIAYQVFGHGREDMLFLPGHITHLDLHWEDPTYAELLEGLGSFARVIAMDRRGVGLSDRLSPEDLPAAEVLVDDVLTVLDDVGSLDAVLFGTDDGAQLGVMLAASRPERVRTLILWGMTPSGVATPERPWAPNEEEWASWIEWALRHYGSRELAIRDIQETSASLVGDERLIEWITKMYRYGVSPNSFVALYRMEMSLDVTDLLPSIRVPTLILHRTEDRQVSVEASRYVAKAIPGAELVELPGSDHFFNSGDVRPVLESVESFLHVDHARPDTARRVRTVLFTDVVGSTEKAASLGDRRWGKLVDDHHARVRAELTRHGGREVDTAGDGFLATFDGPARAVECARSTIDALREIGLEIRVGLHTGELETVGHDVRGIAVHIGARVAALAAPGEILVSSTVKDLVAGSGLTFEDRGEHELKGVPDRWRLYRVANEGT